MKLTVVLAGMVVMVLTCSTAGADLTPGPGASAALGGVGAGVGARAMGMGGAYTALAGDATALYWNPAGLSKVNGLDWATSVNAKAEGIDAADEIKDVYDSIDDDTIDLDTFESLLDIAKRCADKPVWAAAGGISSFAIHNVGVGAFGEVGVDAVLSYSGDEGAEAVGVTGSAGWWYSAGAGLSRSITPNATVGIGVRKLWVGYRASEYTAQRTGPTVLKTTEADTGTMDDDDFAVDVGFQFRTPEDLLAGLMIRNINSPNLFLTDDVGQGVRYEMEPVINVGLAKQFEDWTFALDVHNLSNDNKAGISLHLGAEKRFGDWLALRAGLHDDELGFGLGLDLGPVTLDIAADEEFENLAALQVTLDF